MAELEAEEERLEALIGRSIKQQRDINELQAELSSMEATISSEQEA